MANISFLSFLFGAVVCLVSHANADTKDFVLKVYERKIRPTFSLGLFRFLGNHSWNQKYRLLENSDSLLVIPEGQVCSLMYWKIGKTWRCDPDYNGELKDQKNGVALFEENGEVQVKLVLGGAGMEQAKAVIVGDKLTTFHDATMDHFPHIYVEHSSGRQAAFPIVDAESAAHKHLIANDIKDLEFTFQAIIKSNVPVLHIFGKPFWRRWQTVGSATVDVPAEAACVLRFKDNTEKTDLGNALLECGKDAMYPTFTHARNYHFESKAKFPIGVFPFSVNGKLAQVDLARAANENLDAATTAIMLPVDWKWLKNSFGKNILECGDHCRLELPDTASASKKNDVSGGKVADELVMPGGVESANDQHMMAKEHSDGQVKSVGEGGATQSIEAQEAEGTKEKTALRGSAEPKVVEIKPHAVAGVTA